MAPSLSCMEAKAMLYTEEQLQDHLNPFSILDESIYLTETENQFQSSMVPVYENMRLESYVIDFDGIKSLSESTGWDYFESIEEVAGVNDLNLDNIVISINEEDIILDPNLINIGPVVIKPLSEMDEEFQFVLEVVNNYLETENEVELDLLFEDAHPRKKQLEKARALSGKGRSEMAANTSGLSSTTKASDLPNNYSNNRFSLKDTINYQRWAKKFITPFADPDAEDEDLSLDAIYKWSPFKKAKKVIGLVTPTTSTKKSEQLRNNSGGSSGGGGKSGSSGGSVLGTVKSAITGGSSGGGGNNPPSGSGGSTIGRVVNSISGLSTGKKIGIGVGAAAAIGGSIYAINKYRNQPKSVIAKRIAALRHVYAKFMENARRNPAKAGVFKRAAAKLLSVIDRLLAFLQRKADGR